MITSSDVYTHHNRRCRLRLAQYHMEMLISNILRDKSFVDDLNKEQGIVSMRVGSALRSTEIKPLFPDLWRTHMQMLFANSNHPSDRGCTGWRLSDGWLVLRRKKHDYAGYGQLPVEWW